MYENERIKIYNYWNKTEFGKKLINSGIVSDSELLFLIPNNKKKILGLPMTRLGNRKNKKKYKINKQRNIILFKMFNILEEMLEQRLLNINFDNFINYKDLELGNNIFETYSIKIGDNKYV